MNTTPLRAEDTKKLLAVLAERFATHSLRDQNLDWKPIEARLLEQPHKLGVLFAMEETGGEPQVLTTDPSTGDYLFFDTAAESPALRRSLCYDRAALDARKENKPGGAAVEMATTMGAELLTEEQYFTLQRYGHFDLKTSSWLQTPAEVRSLGGALFGDRRYGRVFVYHNGAGSYYAARGFRTLLRV